MSSSNTRPWPAALAAAALLFSIPAQAAWFDYTTEGHDGTQEDRLAPDLTWEDTTDGRMGLVFVHGMGDRDCRPVPDEAAATPWERLGLTSYTKLDLASYDTFFGVFDEVSLYGHLDDAWIAPTVPKGHWVMLPNVRTSQSMMERTLGFDGEKCSRNSYWGRYVLEQAAAIGHPTADGLKTDGLRHRMPVLVAGYDQRDAWYGGDGGSAAEDVARQISVFADAYELDRVTVVAHSMGGVVMRDLITRAAHEPGDDELAAGADVFDNPDYAIHDAASHITRVVTLASPQGGSYGANAVQAMADSGADVGESVALLVDAVREVADLVAGDLFADVPLIGGALDWAWDLVWDAVSAVVDVLLLGVDGLLAPLGWLVPGLPSLMYGDANTASLTTHEMAAQNRGRLYGTDGRPALAVPWLNLSGTATRNFQTGKGLDRLASREREQVCAAGSIYIPALQLKYWGPDIVDKYGCVEDLFLPAFAGWRVRGAYGGGGGSPTDGMVHTGSAELVGRQIGRSKSQHAAMAHATASYTTESLDLIGLLRFYGHADGAPSDELLTYEAAYRGVDITGAPLPRAAHAPVGVRPRVGSSDDDCSTTAVSGARGDFVTHTGQFDLIWLQRYTPTSREDISDWPAEYRIRVHKEARSWLPGFGEHGDHLGVSPFEVTTVAMDVPNPVARPAGPGIEVVSLPIDLTTMPSFTGGPERFGGAAGAYRFEVEACTAEGICSPMVSAEDAVHAELSEFIDPDAWESRLACSLDVDGGRARLDPDVGAIRIDSDIVEAAVERAGDWTPNVWKHADDPVWSRPSEFPAD
jgi:hypothetical protein